MPGTDFLQRIAASVRTTSNPEPQAAGSQENQEAAPLPRNAPAIESLNASRKSSWFMLVVLGLIAAGAAAFVASPDLGSIITRLKSPPANQASQEMQPPAATSVQVAVDEPPPPAEPPSTKPPIQLVPATSGATSPPTRDVPASGGTSPIPAVAASRPAIEAKPEPDIRYVGTPFIDTSRIAEADGVRETRAARPPQVAGNELDARAQVSAGGSRDERPDTLGARLASVSGKYATSVSRTVHDRRNTILAGSVIDCTLDDAINSSLPGLLSCTVARDIWSDDGSCKLIPKGAQGVGEYAGGLQQGQRRIFVIWNRLQAAGTLVDLGSPGTDALGRSGIEGDYDSRFLERFRGALLLSMVSGAANRGNASNNVMAPAVQAGANAALEMDMKIPPVVTLDHGSKIMIKVARDLQINVRCEGRP